MPRQLRVPGFQLQLSPLIYVTAIPGPWLLDHSTPSWRIKKPRTGFQRIVKKERAEQIAIAVLDQKRSFPNAIVLATDHEGFVEDHGHLTIPGRIRFLVVDGQHRLYAQEYSDYEARYACVIHMRLSEVEMARLFLEINDNQKRVPASLRWDLVRLVRPADDPYAIAAAELIYELANERSSALYQRVDLTGEQNEIKLKQASLAPELKTLVSMRPPGLRDFPFDAQFEILSRYLAAIRASDPDGWKQATGPFHRARVLRVLLRLLPTISKKAKQSADKMKVEDFKNFIDRIDKGSLSDEAIRQAQGSAGMKQIHDTIRAQMHV